MSAPVRPQERRTDAAPTLCACGCGTPLRGAQRRYSSRACTMRAQWAAPSRVPHLRQALGKRRVALWERRADITRAVGALDAAGVLDGLTREEWARLRLVLAETIQRVYRQGYGVGFAAGQRQRQGRAA